MYRRRTFKEGNESRRRRKRISCSHLTAHVAAVSFFPPSRSVAVKEMFCIFWMRAIPAMPTGCGLSIRRLHRSRRTWQPFRYISTLQTMNPSDLPERKKMINITDICQTSKPEVRNYVNYFKFDLRKYGNLIFFWKKPWKQDRNDRLFSAAIYCFCCVKNHRCACKIK